MICNASDRPDWSCDTTEVNRWCRASRSWWTQRLPRTSDHQTRRWPFNKNTRLKSAEHLSVSTLQGQRNTWKNCERRNETDCKTWRNCPFLLIRDSDVLLDRKMKKAFVPHAHTQANTSLGCESEKGEGVGDEWKVRESKANKEKRENR